MRWIHEHKEIRTRGLAKGIAYTADAESVEMAQWLMKRTLNWNGSSHSSAVSHREAGSCYDQADGNQFMWDDLEFDYSGFWLFKPIGAHDRWVNGVIRYTAEHGQLDTVQYLYNHYLHDSNGTVLCDAALNDHFEVVKWLHQQNLNIREQELNMPP